jgi:hypothetical protein
MRAPALLSTQAWNLMNTKAIFGDNKDVTDLVLLRESSAGL